MRLSLAIAKRGRARYPQQVADECTHSERLEGPCPSCGDCEHTLVLNGACYYCGATELELSNKPTRDELIPVSNLTRRRD
jgi:hypothetical protein